MHWAVRVYGLVTLAYAGLMVSMLVTLAGSEMGVVPPYGLTLRGCLAAGGLGAAPGLAAVLGWRQARPLFLVWGTLVVVGVGGAYFAFTSRVTAHPDVFVLLAGWPAMCVAAFGIAFGAPLTRA